MKIADVFPHFKRHALDEKGLMPKTIREIISISKLLADFHDNPTLKSLSTLKIREFMYYKKSERMWSSKTFRNRRQQLKTFFDYCMDEQYINTNPVTKIEKPKIPKSLPRYLNRHQIDSLLLSLDNYSWYNSTERFRNKAIFRTFILTGIRLNELLNLKTISINFTEHEIVIFRGKGGRDRIVPIHPDLMPHLKAYHQAKNKTPTEYFFTSLRSNKPLSAKAIYRIIKKLRSKVKFHFTPHMFRHTFGKLSIEANINPFNLQKMLGHSSISTTQIYVYVSNQNLKEIFQKTKLL